MLASCGGGTSAYDPFVPQRLFAFGDEASAFTADGHNYGINGINTNATADLTSDDYFDCTLQPNWVQTLANSYGFYFAECPAAGAKKEDAKAVSYAAAGARVAEVEAQVDAQVAKDGFRDKDIATLLVGTNDIVELYGRYDGSNEAALTSEATERGRRTGLVVNRLVALGSKVVVSNIPDLAYTPYAVSEAAAHPGEDRSGVLSRLSAAFNQALGVTMLIDGRYVALAQTDQRIIGINRSPESYAIANAVAAACATPPPLCDTSTLVTDASATTWLWAGPTLLGSRGQSELAYLAVTRAQRNPF
ncbi:MAG: esterase [Rubrivivax sp.]|nr:esterase [Rubrivivax sp.]